MRRPVAGSMVANQQWLSVLAADGGKNIANLPTGGAWSSCFKHPGFLGVVCSDSWRNNTPDPSLQLMISLAHTLNSPLRPAFPFIPGNPGSPGGPTLPGIPMKPGSPLMPGKVQRKASQSLAWWCWLRGVETRQRWGWEEHYQLASLYRAIGRSHVWL